MAAGQSIRNLRPQGLDHVFVPPGLPMMATSSVAPATTSLLVRGGAGAGKTTVAVGIAHALAKQQAKAALYFGTTFVAGELSYKLELLGLPSECLRLAGPTPQAWDTLAPGTLVVEHMLPSPGDEAAISVSDVLGRARSVVEREQRPAVVVIDAIASARGPMPDERVRDRAQACAQILANVGISVIFVEDIVEPHASWLPFAVDVVLELELEYAEESGKFVRRLACPKVRHGRGLPGPHACGLTPTGEPAVWAAGAPDPQALPPRPELPPTHDLSNLDGLVTRLSKVYRNVIIACALVIAVFSDWASSTTECRALAEVQALEQIVASLEATRIPNVLMGDRHRVCFVDAKGQLHAPSVDRPTGSRWPHEVGGMTSLKVLLEDIDRGAYLGIMTGDASDMRKQAELEAQEWMKQTLEELGLDLPPDLRDEIANDILDYASTCEPESKSVQVTARATQKWLCRQLRWLELLRPSEHSRCLGEGAWQRPPDFEKRWAPLTLAQLEREPLAHPGTHVFTSMHGLGEDYREEVWPNGFKRVRGALSNSPHGEELMKRGFAAAKDYLELKWRAKAEERRPYAIASIPMPSLQIALLVILVLMGLLGLRINEATGMITAGGASKAKAADAHLDASKWIGFGRSTLTRTCVSLCLAFMPAVAIICGYLGQRAAERALLYECRATNLGERVPGAFDSVTGFEWLLIVAFVLSGLVCALLLRRLWRTLDRGVSIRRVARRALDRVRERGGADVPARETLRKSWEVAAKWWEAAIAQPFNSLRQRLSSRFESAQEGGAPDELAGVHRGEDDGAADSLGDPGLSTKEGGRGQGAHQAQED